MLSKDDFDYNFNQNLIANSPLEKRDHSKLLVVNREKNSLTDLHFYDLSDLLHSGDVLVLNDTKVLPARLKGTKSTGGKVEILLIHAASDWKWWVISHPGLKIGRVLTLNGGMVATVVDQNVSLGYYLLEFQEVVGKKFLDLILEFGETPLPLYIHNNQDEKQVRQRYQTVFAHDYGSVAAPTAGLHFTPEILQKLQGKGVLIEYVTLHVGPGTFQNLREENLKTKQLHEEWFNITPEVSQRLIAYKKEGKRIISVGTTATRTLESAFIRDGEEMSFKTGWQTTSLFIYPPYQFQFVNCLITNFHWPKTSLIMLVTALACFPNTPFHFQEFKETLIARAYKHATDNHYRFYSFGDSMFVC